MSEGIPCPILQDGGAEGGRTGDGWDGESGWGGWVRPQAIMPPSSAVASGRIGQGMGEGWVGGEKESDCLLLARQLQNESGGREGILTTRHPALAPECPEPDRSH
jgi:hypothetical protein